VNDARLPRGEHVVHDVEPTEDVEDVLHHLGRDRDMSSAQLGNLQFALLSYHVLLSGVAAEERD
jgi:hypothetical protein